MGGGGICAVARVIVARWWIATDEERYLSVGSYCLEWHQAVADLQPPSLCWSSREAHKEWARPCLCQVAWHSSAHPFQSASGVGRLALGQASQQSQQHSGLSLAAGLLIMP